MLQLLLDLTYIQRVIDSTAQGPGSSSFAAAVDALVQQCELTIQQRPRRDISAWLGSARSSLPVSQRILRTVSGLASNEVQRTRMNAALLGSATS